MKRFAALAPRAYSAGRSDRRSYRFESLVTTLGHVSPLWVTFRRVVVHLFRSRSARARTRCLRRETSSALGAYFLPLWVTSFTTLGHFLPLSVTFYRSGRFWTEGSGPLLGV
eukprot:4791340-Pyramimonas_sp.AAC.1